MCEVQKLVRKKERQTMNNQQIAHEWASQNKQSGKGSHFFYEGRTIYSYGAHFPIAHWEDSETVLFTSEGYSPTTAKHKSYVLRAIPSRVTVYTVPFVVTGPKDHERNALYLLGEYNKAKAAALKAIKQIAVKQVIVDNAARDFCGYVRTFSNSIQNADTLREAKRLFRRGPIWTKAQRKEFARRELREAELASTAMSRKQAREEAANKAAALELDKWKAGEDIRNGHFHALPCAIRCKDGSLQTSHGATVPFLDGFNLFKNWRAGAAKPGDIVGLYTVREVHEEKLVIGCHTIDREEAERFFSGN